DLEIDDEIKINFNQQEYKYKVSEKKIIPADDLSVLLPTEREILTLLTCWPVGTADKRLIVIAKPEK
ncbi:MAG: sortase, partial [Patescibacteria group bacterium]|nr:sortase [Patescibacteria group bacterium]